VNCIFSETNVVYKIYATTSDMAYAGTDANVHIQMYGKFARTEKLALKKSTTHKNPFEQVKT
jgi:hypothetical protein